MTEAKLKRANFLFYNIDRLNDLEKEIWENFAAEHEEQFMEISKAMFIIKAKLQKEFDEIKCD